MEEIDIIELFKRVEEGKPPNKIEINGEKYTFNNEWEDINDMYECDNGNFYEQNIGFNTKIKILDKPIIEELSKDDMLYGYIMGNKINEIIKWINNKE